MKDKIKWLSEQLMDYGDIRTLAPPNCPPNKNYKGCEQQCSLCWAEYIYNTLFPKGDKKGLVENPYVLCLDLKRGFDEGIKAQKALTIRLESEKTEKYAKLVDKEDKFLGDIFRECADPEFRYTFDKENRVVDEELREVRKKEIDKLKGEIKSLGEWLNEKHDRLLDEKRPAT